MGADLGRSKYHGQDLAGNTTMSGLMRATALEEAPRIHQLIRAIEVAEGQPLVTPVAEVEEFFTEPGVDVPADLRVIEEAGELVGWARVQHYPSGERLERVFCFGGVHPDHRAQGHGRQLLSWTLDRANEKLATTPVHLAGYAVAWAHENQTEFAHLASRFGIAPARYDDELQRDLGDLPPIPQLSGVTIRRWNDGDPAATAEGTRLAYNASFADHWGSTPRTPESWVSHLEANGSRPDLSFVAVDEATGGIVAYTLNDHWPEDEAVTGRLDGWIGSLGTLREYRKRGIASALIAASLHGFVEAGLNSAMLSVDTENPSGAYGIYERLGFHQIRRNITYRRLLRPGQDQLSSS